MQQEKLMTARPGTIDIQGEEPMAYDMIVCCHLRWDFVYQRPQHIINRMSAKYRILFVEEPIPHDPTENNTADLIQVNPNLAVLKPKVSSIADLKYLIPHYVLNASVNIGWFYSSAFVPILNFMEFNTIVYDCMDELTLFKGASELLSAQEIYLLSEADIVFTGGKSLYEVKKQTHDHVYCFPSSVDRNHFAFALNGEVLPDDMPTGKPVVGYYGVIDERIDLSLLKMVAEKTPDVSFVLIGPVVKIDPAHLPVADNLFYPGMKPYSMLPKYLRGFNIAMMPFELNEATKFISPTKTLEYMAAHKPIISTPVYDVVRDYKDCVSIVNSAEEFHRAVHIFLQMTTEKQAKLVEQYEAILNNTSWDTTVEKMQEIISNQLKLNTK